VNLSNIAAHASGSSPERVAARASQRLPAAEYLAVRREPPTEGAMDEALAESFPASDPPAWNPGLARLVPVEGRDPALKP
jgi:hypothetical protein